MEKEKKEVFRFKKCESTTFQYCNDRLRTACRRALDGKDGVVRCWGAGPRRRGAAMQQDTGPGAGRAGSRALPKPPSCPAPCAAMQPCPWLHPSWWDGGAFPVARSGLFANCSLLGSLQAALLPSPGAHLPPNPLPRCCLPSPFKLASKAPFEKAVGQGAPSKPTSPFHTHGNALPLTPAQRASFAS